MALIIANIVKDNGRVDVACYDGETIMGILALATDLACRYNSVDDTVKGLKRQIDRLRKEGSRKVFARLASERVEEAVGRP